MALKEIAVQVGRASAKVKRGADYVRKAVDERGGIGEIVQEEAERAGAHLGTVVGHVAKFADGAQQEIERLPNPAKVYRRGKVDVSTYATRGQEIGASVAVSLRSGADRVAAAASRMTSDISSVVEAARDGANDYVPVGDARKVQIGPKKYVVGSDSRRIINATGAYANRVGIEVAGKAGRPELMQFIASYAVTSRDELEQKWTAEGKPESNAYRLAIEK